MYMVTIIAALLASAALVASFMAMQNLRRRLKRKGAELYIRKVELDQERRERRKAVDALNLTEQSYRAMFANTRDIVLVFAVTAEDLPESFQEVNEVACQKLGYRREKLLTLSMLSVEAVQSPTAVLRHSRIHDTENTVGELDNLTDDQAVLRERLFPYRRRLRQIREEMHVVYETTFVTADGERIPVEVSAHHFEIKGQAMVMCTAHDIAHRKQTERKLRESERRFHDFFNHSPLGVAMYDPQHELQDVNQSFLRMLGIPDRNEFAAFDIFDNPFMPQDAKDRLSAGDSLRFEMQIDFDRARGERIFLTAKRGKGYVDMLYNNLGFDADFNPKGYLVQALDVTRRHTTEDALHEREQELQQAQKMEAIGTLAGGIAHDFNNILTPILGYAEITLDSVEKDSEVYVYTREILKASSRARELVNQILTFSRRSDDESKRRPAHIIPLVKEVLALMRGSIQDNITIERAIKTEHDVVVCDPTQIHQVIMNLCTNARHAMRDSGGTLEVRVTDFMVDRGSRGQCSNLKEGRYIQVAVRDTGTGMDRQTAERVFEPFFTTKKSGEGTGMGLSVAHGIVTALGGTITIESELGQGSTFRVVLPVIERDAADPDTESETAPRGTESIIFVDDEPEIARMASHMLSSLGYEATVCTEPAECLTIFQREPLKFDLLVTDQVMPDLTGTELARKCRSLRADLPVILCSGFRDAVPKEEARFLGIERFLAKPISRSQLAHTLRETLDSREASHPEPSE